MVKKTVLINVLTISILNVSHAFALSCAGTEPFWHAKVTDTTVTLEHEGNDFSALRVASKYALGMKQSFIEKSTLVNGEDHIGDLTIINSKCSDGMSDIVYDYEIIIDKYDRDRVYYGCCK